MAEKELTEKQKRFVEEYLVDLNATQAAIRAGYAASGARTEGSRLLANADIAAAIGEARKAQSERTLIDADYVLNTVRETVERCRQIEPVLDRKGEQVLTTTRDGSLAKAFMFDAKNVLKGCELLGRNLSLWKDRVEHTGKDGAPIEWYDVNLNEVARRAIHLLERAVERKRAISQDPATG